MKYTSHELTSSRELTLKEKIIPYVPPFFAQKGDGILVCYLVHTHMGASNMNPSLTFYGRGGPVFRHMTRSVPSTPLGQLESPSAQHSTAQHQGRTNKRTGQEDKRTDTAPPVGEGEGVHGRQDNDDDDDDDARIKFVCRRPAGCVGVDLFDSRKT